MYIVNSCFKKDPQEKKGPTGIQWRKTFQQMIDTGTTNCMSSWSVWTAVTKIPQAGIFHSSGVWTHDQDAGRFGI